MRYDNVHYFVEGDGEKKLLGVLKTQLKVIQPGRIQKYNVLEQKITDAMLRPFNRKTLAVLVFDTDTNNVGFLMENIQKLNACGAVAGVITIPQVPNLEEELRRSCHLRKITDLLGSQSLSAYKSDFIHISNLDAKLKEHNFDISLLWTQSPPAPYQHIHNDADVIKL